MYCDESELIGKKLNKITTDNEGGTLHLHTDDGIYEFSPQGDCCSQSWIEHFDEVARPGTIVSFEEKEIPPSYEIKPTKYDHYQDKIEHYFYELKTDNARYLIEMRNSSNGYYGGYLTYNGKQEVPNADQ